MNHENDTLKLHGSRPPRLFPDSRFCSRCLELQMPDLYLWVITSTSTVTGDENEKCRRRDAIFQRVIFDVDVPLESTCLSCELIHDQLYGRLLLPCDTAHMSIYKLGSNSRKVRHLDGLYYGQDVVPFKPMKEIRTVVNADGEKCWLIDIDDCPHNRLLRDPDAAKHLDITRSIFPPVCRPIGSARRFRSDTVECRRSVSFDVIDYHHLRHLLSFCQLKHTTCPPGWHSDLQFIRLIDVRNRQLVPYSTATRPEYAALSYVWGRGVQAPRPKNGQVPATTLPVIDDAIAATKELHLQYLWVDAICIDQDDTVSKMQQISIMNHIYSGAFVTLIAADSDSALTGLPRMPAWHGLQAANKDHARSTDPKNTSLEQINMQDLTDPTHFIDLELGRVLRHAPWAKRGWTFQEALFSSRSLIFTNHRFYFHCNQMVCCESLNVYSVATLHYSPGIKDFAALPDPILAGLHNPMLRSLHTLDSFHKFEAVAFVVRDYIPRDFTFEEDTLHAITGVLNEFKATIFPEGFYFGLPLADFRTALNWEGWAGTDELGVLLEGRKEQFPSWSWLGWRLVGAKKQTTDAPLVNQPLLSIWTSSGEQIVQRRPPKESSGCELEKFVITVNREFDGLPEPNFAQSRGIIASPKHLLVQGILIHLRFLRSHPGDSDEWCRLETPTGRSLWACQYMSLLMPAKKCSSKFASSQRSPDKTEKLLMLSVHHLGTGVGPFRPEDEDGVQLHLLFLRWEGMFAHRLGRIVVRMKRAELAFFEECRPSLETFVFA